MNPSEELTILVIEDDDSVRQTLNDILTLNGYSVTLAKDGTTGLASARSSPPALILSDIGLPGLSGLDLLRSIQEDHELRSIPMILLTANVDRPTNRLSMELGAADFITKPFTESEVINSITARLEKKALLDELDAFAHTVAHDLKNPLCTLMGRLDLALSKTGEEDRNDVRHQLQEASHAANRLNNIIDELLVLCGVRKQQVVPTSLNMSEIISEAIGRLDRLFRQTNARVVLADHWPVAVGHAPWVTEVWVNYLSNAAKYGGPSPTIVVGSELMPDGHQARFWVQDQGPGLTQEQRKQVFTPFAAQQFTRPTGHGLGLSIVHRITKKLGGAVGYETCPPQGSRFWFTLPLSAGKSVERTSFLEH